MSGRASALAAGGFDQLVRTATGFEPYDYQRRIAKEGLPEVLAVPTGCGKTQAAVLGWLYRRKFHSDAAVHAATPRWLVFVLPMRVLAEQTVGSVRRWLEALGLEDDVTCHLLMGGEPRTAAWRLEAERDTILVATLDMVVSRQLNRGYGETRFNWPIDFGLFNNGCQFVFDEVQLMGPALATTRQLHGLRDRFGVAMPCRSTWMSATVDERLLGTVDAPHLGTTLGLSDADRAGNLATRLDATKVVHELAVDSSPTQYPKDLAGALASRHRAGTLTLAVLNTVERARQTHAALVSQLAADHGIDVVLLHSRFRPGDRKIAVDRALATLDPTGQGRVIVSTQVVEAGVDLSAATLVTEAAPWPSVVQRAGRCNRDGKTPGAELAWVRPPKHLPYEEADIAASVAELVSLEGAEVTPASLVGREVAVTVPIVPVLRAKDLLELFDTAPDLGGNDVDVARFIRDADDLDVAFAWRPLTKDGPADSDPLPGPMERCPVPVGEARAYVTALGSRGLRLWRFDHLDATWRPAGTDDVRPGAVFLVPSEAGGYRPETGWDRDSKLAVQPVVAPVDPARSALAPDDRALDDDPASFGTRWLSLTEHLADVEAEVVELSTHLDASGIEPGYLAALVVAARYHDIGKAHRDFQAMLRAAGGEGDTGPDGLLAKSPRRVRTHNQRHYFRHELASMLALCDEEADVLAGVAEADLVRYLVAAHHGRIRLGCRAHPEEAKAGTRRVLGVEDGEELPAVAVPGAQVPSTRLDLGILGLGSGHGRRSWTATALALRDRGDLGVFRLAFLEAVLRLADWRASDSPGRSLGGQNHG